MPTLPGACPGQGLSLRTQDGHQPHVHTFVPSLAAPLRHPCEAGPPPTQDGADGWACKSITRAPALKLALHPALGG